MVVVKARAEANAAPEVLRHTEALLRSGEQREATKLSPHISAH